MSDDAIPAAAAVNEAEPVTVATPAYGGSSGDVSAKLEERPELALGGAFAGGLLVALILKRLAR